MKNLLSYGWLLALLLMTSLSAHAQNLALRKTATASSANKPAANAVDGDGTTRWESAPSDSQQLTVDLGTVQAIDRVRLSWENAYGRDFTIQVSSDNTTWTTVATVTGNATTYNDFTNLATSGRYVRMAGTARATSYGYSLYEVEVFASSPSTSSNLALGKTAVASSAQGGFEPAKAFDGNTTSRWGSTYNDNQWLYVDLGRTTNITQVNLIWEIAYGKDFRLDVSSDATTWTTVTTVSNNNGHINEIPLTATGRYVRMFGLTRGTGYGFSLYEMQVLGSYVAPLPVELTSFQATATTGGAVALSWATASEKNSARFEVERSLDGETFQAVGQVAAAGSSSISHTYALTDAKVPSGVLYYRLRQVDQDGMATYSPVRSVVLSGPSGLALYPNPTRGAATAVGLIAGTTVSVYDLMGRHVTQAVADASGAASFVLPTGVYVVRTHQQSLRLTVE